MASRPPPGSPRCPARQRRRAGRGCPPRAAARAPRSPAGRSDAASTRVTSGRGPASRMRRWTASATSTPPAPAPTTVTRTGPRRAGAARASIRAPQRDRLAHGPDGHRVLPNARDVEAGRSRAHVERQDVEGEPRSARLHGAPVDVDPLGRGLDDPHPGAGGERGEIDGQVRLRVHALEEARHHAGVVVPRRRRSRASRRRRTAAGRRDRPGRGGGRDRRLPGRAASWPEARRARPGLSGSAPLRTAPVAGALRTTPAGSGTARAGGAAARSARARGPRPGIARSEPSA